MPYKYRSREISGWLIPFIYAVLALLIGFTVPRLTYDLTPAFMSTISVNAAIGVYSAVASGMLALTGIVFSITFVMVQFSATAYSPRLVLWIARDRVSSHAIGVFTATFLYALCALAWVDRGNSGRVPMVALIVVVVLLITSVMMFVSLIHRTGMLQVTRMLAFTGDRGRQIVENLYLPIEASAATNITEVVDRVCVQTVFHKGHPQTVQAIDISGAIALASKAGCIIQLVPSVGETVFDSIPILRVWGGSGRLPESGLTALVTLGKERTFEQDPEYAIRLLVDIAIKALSPAVNDPTTAVQTLDQIEDLLIRLGRRRLEIGTFFDESGKLRLTVAFPTWEDFLRLAFDEIRYYGATSLQVMRRMRALVAELISVLPAERRAALDYWQQRIQGTVDRSFGDREDKKDASEEDRQGLGSPQRPLPDGHTWHATVRSE